MTASLVLKLPNVSRRKCSRWFAALELTVTATPAMLRILQRAEKSHYATLGLDRGGTDAQIRNAYRLLAKQRHPDLNPHSPEAVKHTQALNAAYEVLSDPAQRLAYDRELDTPRKPASPPRGVKIQRNLTQDVHLRIEDFLRGTNLEVQVKDPAGSPEREIYQLTVPPETAPGTRFRLPRHEPFAGGFVTVRVRALPGFRFKVRGSDLRCDLKIKPERAAEGGMEMIPGVNGGTLRVPIPRGVGRGEIIRIPGEGLPRPRGGRGDVLVRITYRPEVHISRTSGR
jgi:curved DNA-binding protein